MRRSDFAYELPGELIAQHPLAVRSHSRLLWLDLADRPEDRRIGELPALLRAGDLLVFNDTRVMPARLHGRKESGGRVELLVERVLDDHRVLAQARSSKPLRPAGRLRLGDAGGGVTAEVVGARDGFFELRIEDPRPAPEIMEALGHVPLPPYITRPDQALDRERYQTVFARRYGAVAAPTAGLHFDETLLRHLDEAGVERAWITLHVGAGTFQPVRSEDLGRHRMHKEWVEVGPEVCAQIRSAHARGARVIAVGTTVVRALESASRCGRLEPFSGETDLFITPGYRFRVVDALITNFHMPCSTLLMLVCAFGGTGRVLRAYRHAVGQGYRFFSYGDAMFVGRQDAAPGDRGQG